MCANACHCIYTCVSVLRTHVQAMSLVVFTNRLMSGVIALSYVEIVRALTAAGSFLAFTALSAVSVVFYYKCVPETAGKTLEQVLNVTPFGDSAALQS
jgi:Sugar (and other) transporter